jgi:dethiobiotin synthetase
MKDVFFITGIGTNVGKTVVSAIITEALTADYWKPVQAGFEEGTDALTVKSLISNTVSQFHKEVYKLAMPASPHIAAKAENVTINLSKIVAALPATNNYLIIEGAGGLMVPLNEQDFILDLIKQLKAKVILVSQNYLGSINHSLLTAAVCKQHNIEVLGWVFNDTYLNYMQEIVTWTQYPLLAHIPKTTVVTKEFILHQAQIMKESLCKFMVC